MDHITELKSEISDVLARRSRLNAQLLEAKKRLDTKRAEMGKAVYDDEADAGKIATELHGLELELEALSAGVNQSKYRHDALEFNLREAENAIALVELDKAEDAILTQWGECLQSLRLTQDLFEQVKQEAANFTQQASSLHAKRPAISAILTWIHNLENTSFTVLCYHLKRNYPDLWNDEP